MSYLRQFWTNCEKIFLAKYSQNLPASKAVENKISDSANNFIDHIKNSKNYDIFFSVYMFLLIIVWRNEEWRWHFLFWKLKLANEQRNGKKNGSNVNRPGNNRSRGFDLWIRQTELMLWIRVLYAFVLPQEERKTFRIFTFWIFLVRSIFWCYTVGNV